MQAQRAEAAGFDSMWLGDHIISPEQIASAYPYTPSGEVPWVPELAMFEAVVAATVSAMATARIEIGFGTLVLPLRHPVVLAKQLASLDQFAAGRVVLGAGVGWLREEFVALGVNFEQRKSVTAEWIELLRACWTGRPGLFDGDHYQLGVATACYPTPARRLPILVGGKSSSALELVSRLADGWYPLLSESELTAGWLAPRWERVREGAQVAGRNADELTLSICTNAALDLVGQRIPELAAVGVKEIVVSIDWDHPGSAEAAVRQLRLVERSGR